MLYYLFNQQLCC